MDGAAPVIVTFDIVPAIALRSPATVGEICAVDAVLPLLRCAQLGLCGRTALVARSGFAAVTFTAASEREIAREREVGDELVLVGLALHAPARRLEAGRADVDEVVARALLEAHVEVARAVASSACSVERSGPRVTITVGDERMRGIVGDASADHFGHRLLRNQGRGGAHDPDDRAKNGSAHTRSSVVALLTGPAGRVRHDWRRNGWRCADAGRQPVQSASWGMFSLAASASSTSSSSDR